MEELNNEKQQTAQTENMRRKKYEEDERERRSLNELLQQERQKMAIVSKEKEAVNAQLEKTKKELQEMNEMFVKVFI